jgi:hypothetical protein
MYTSASSSSSLTAAAALNKEVSSPEFGDKKAYDDLAMATAAAPGSFCRLV